MTMNPQRYDYPSRRRVVYGTHGMVCASQPLAANAGLDMLKKGGNAVDAAIAAAITLTVTEPTSNGIGSDTFALVWMNDSLHGLNGSGWSPAEISLEKVRAMGYETMPERGWTPVNIPGTPSAWYELSAKFGKLPFAELFAPAIDYARNGYPVSPVIARLWNNQFKQFSRELKAECFRPWFDTFAQGGRTPEPGEVWRCPHMADTLEILANTGCADFYHGALAKKMDAFSREHGGFLQADDLAGYKAVWVDPISVHYKGYEVWELPPNGHGLVVLMMLNMLRNDKFSGHDDIDTIHRQLEAMKLSFADGQKYITDPRVMRRSVEQLLSPDYADRRRALIGDTARPPVAGDPACGGTIYLTTADSEGGMVSLIQSNYRGFGSGIVIPGTGISLNDRGYSYSLDPNDDNCLAPSKRPYHTIIPGFLTRDGRAVGPFGVMGEYMQPQGQVQVVMNTIDFDMNPQCALDAPRWQWVGGMKIEVEPGFPQHLVEELAARGHQISIAPNSLSFGRGQIIWRDENGTLCGATEPRTDGTVAAY
ncbi:MAG: gamma-glutamyltransferase family protein [Candidatus Heteroscillospira sp.]